MWVYGTILAQSACQNAVIAALLAVGVWHGLRNRLREWFYDGPDHAAPCQTQLEVKRCFAPLLRWVLAQWQGLDLARAMDATAPGERVVVLVLSVLSRSRAIPVAWHVLPANSPGAWMLHMLRLLRQLAPRGTPPPAGGASWPTRVCGVRACGNAPGIGAGPHRPRAMTRPSFNQWDSRAARSVSWCQGPAMDGWAPGWLLAPAPWRAAPGDLGRGMGPKPGAAVGGLDRSATRAGGRVWGQLAGVDRAGLPRAQSGGLAMAAHSADSPPTSGPTLAGIGHSDAVGIDLWDPCRRRRPAGSAACTARWAASACPPESVPAALACQSLSVGAQLDTGAPAPRTLVASAVAGAGTLAGAAAPLVHHLSS